MADANLTPAISTSNSAMVIPNTSIRHDCVAQDGISQFPFQTTNLSPHKVGITQVHIPENLFQEGTSEVSITQVSTFQAGLPQIGTSQIRVPQVSTTQISLSYFSSSQSGISQIAPFEWVTQKGSSQTSTTQVSTSQIRTPQIGTSQVNPTQIGTSQVGTPQDNSSEISLSGSIASQQFFSSNLHNSSSQSVYNIKNTALVFWNSLLKPQTPFDVNLIVKDLPTGQLAEAVITKYDDSGRPNGGTLLIDSDANGLGWFFDPTPTDNSEFTTSLTDNC